jgi:hypothetical protein
MIFVVPDGGSYNEIGIKFPSTNLYLPEGQITLRFDTNLVVVVNTNEYHIPIAGFQNLKTNPEWLIFYRQIIKDQDQHISLLESKLGTATQTEIIAKRTATYADILSVSVASVACVVVFWVYLRAKRKLNYLSKTALDSVAMIRAEANQEVSDVV